MSGRRLILVIVAALALIAAGLLFLLPRVERALAPSPVSAWVAIEVEGAGEAVVGTVEVEAGTSFRLHAVLEAELSGGERVWFTDAPRLRLKGAEVPAEQLRPWQLPWQVRPLWFTVEGPAPYLLVERPETLDRFAYQTYLRPEWGRLTSVAGDLSSQFRAQLADGAVRDRDFGTQRFQVWIELFRDERDVIPEHRVKAPGPEELLAGADGVATVIARLDGAAAPASAVFGLPQLELAPTAPPELEARLESLVDARLAFTRASVLRAVAAAADRTVSTLDWRPVELGAGVRWGEQVRTGDLLQVGPRFVVLYRDAGEAEILDGADLCFDFEAGAEIRRLDEVFVGDGELDWASLGGTLAEPPGAAE